MELYTGVVYPLVLAVSACLAVLGGVTFVWPRAHRALKLAVPVVYGATALNLVTVVVLLFTSVDVDLILPLGYLVASLAVLALLGIGRLGTPAAASADSDPDRPVLSPAQIVKVDAAAAVIVAIALAVVFWRVFEIIQGAA